MAEIPEVQLQMLQNGVEKVFKDVVRAQQCSSDFVISVSELMDSNVVIKAGYPFVFGSA